MTMHDELGSSVLAWLRGVDDWTRRSLDLLESTGAEVYIVGGAVRDYFLQVSPADLDIVVPNDDELLVAAFDAQYPFRTNRHGNRRYWLGTRTIDVIRPRCFYRNFEHVRDAIAYFDISINALGVRLRDGAFIEEHSGISDIQCRQVRTTGARWSEVSHFEFVHQMLRLLRYVDRYNLRLVDPHVILGGIHRIDMVNWDEIVRFHPLSRELARRQLMQLATVSPVSGTESNARVC